MKRTSRFGRTKYTPSRLRIVAGEFRGRKIDYNGDPATRPMKERTRESVFSLLGGHLDERWCVDLFGGTGILAMESVSRGAIGGVIFELSRHSVQTIFDNLRLLGIADRLRVRNIDTLRWLRDPEKHIADWPQLPWVVFCCPPYALWSEKGEDLCEGILRLFKLSPPGSQFVCETNTDFDIQQSIPEIQWDVRDYTPALIAVAAKPALA